MCVCVRVCNHSLRFEVSIKPAFCDSTPGDIEKKQTNKQKKKNQKNKQKKQKNKKTKKELRQRNF